MMTLGPFSVAKDGTLSPRAPGVRPVVRYVWRGRACAAEVTRDGLLLTALAGRIPSTVERHADRAAVVGALSRLRQELPQGLNLHLMPDHRLLLRRQGQRPPPGAPLAALALVTEMVCFALSLDPYLDRLEEAGARAVAAAGMPPALARA